MILIGTRVRHRKTGCPGKVTWHSKVMDEHGHIVDRYGIDYAGPFPPLELGPFITTWHPDVDDVTGSSGLREIETIYAATLDDWELVQP